jgi:GLPGLI family protein
LNRINVNDKHAVMKNKLIASIFLMTIALTSGALYAQKPGSPFRGVINYKVSYPDSKMEASQQAMLPQTIKVSLSGNKTRIEVAMASLSQIILLDSDQKTTTILLDLMGQKVAMKPNKKTERTDSKEPVIKILPETKEIAGFLCKKAEISFGDEKSKATPLIVYYTESIGNNKIFYENEYRTLPGIPMEFQYKMQGMNMLLTASSVEKGKVTNREFEVPSEYKEMTPEQLREMFGGGKQ